MKIGVISGTSFTSENKNRNNFRSFGYPLLSGAGALLGYSIKLKDIDGPDIVSPTRGGLATKMKTKVPNILGKWKNALAGAFIGMGVMLIADLIMNNRKSKK